MKYVIGVDLVTSSVKVLLVDQKGEVHYSVSKEYPLIQSQPGFSEQNRGRVEKTIQALKLLVQESTGHRDDIEGLVFTDKCMGQLLDHNNHIIRNAILGNDTTFNIKGQSFRLREKQKAGIQPAGNYISNREFLTAEWEN